jgi:riboflavin kinase/FMN adenylyltransferase
MLAAPFQVQGEVVEGDRRGRTLGFPTANLVPDEALVYPGHGVYVARADGVCAAVNVGVRPTFGTGRAVLIEAHLLDRDDDLYGRHLRVDFLERLRGEQRFHAVEDLVAQMHLDVQRTRELCVQSPSEYGLLA